MADKIQYGEAPGNSVFKFLGSIVVYKPNIGQDVDRWIVWDPEEAAARKSMAEILHKGGMSIKQAWYTAYKTYPKTYVPMTEYDKLK